MSLEAHRDRKGEGVEKNRAERVERKEDEAEGKRNSMGKEMAGISSF